MREYKVKSLKERCHEVLNQDRIDLTLKKSKPQAITAVDASMPVPLKDEAGVPMRREGEQRVSRKVETTLSDFSDSYPTIAQANGEILVVIGGGTAALTYLYTETFSENIKHIIILGDHGYWAKASHRLAQPHHILALPNEKSHPFIDPAKHDLERQVHPHQHHSAYVHSTAYQARLEKLRSDTYERLKDLGIQVTAVREAWVEAIGQKVSGQYSLRIKGLKRLVMADKLVLATGAGPARKLPQELRESLYHSSVTFFGEDPEKIQDEMALRVLNYTDILSENAERVLEKRVLVYGGGATAAWAMEVTELNAVPVGWVAKSGFDDAEKAGPRVEAIIKRTRIIQSHALITNIILDHDENGFCLKVTIENQRTSKCNDYHIDYLVNCIGQEAYGTDGLPDIIAPGICQTLTPLLDINDMNGTGQLSKIGWQSDDRRFVILGSAQATYYRKDLKTPSYSSVSDFIPRSGQVPITIGGTVSSVLALTNYMPFSQDTKNLDIKWLSLNIHILNATQLAAYFTICFKDTPAAEINTAVKAFISARAETEFGLSQEDLSRFFRHFFKDFLENADPKFLSNDIDPAKLGLKPVDEPKRPERLPRFWQLTEKGATSSSASIRELGYEDEYMVKAKHPHKPPLQ